jgi:hypothetical protein
VVFALRLFSLRAVPCVFVAQGLAVALEHVDLLEGLLELVFKHLDLEVFLLELGC